MLALALARGGARVRVVDRLDGPSVATRALGVQARTLELYDRIGIAADAVALGRKAVAARMWAGGRTLARVPLGDIGRDLSPFPYLLVLGQDDNERLLGAALRAAGVEVEWRTELVAFEQDAKRVVARLKHADGAETTVTTPWLAGCDGAHSAVRRLAGIDFPGAPYEHVFFVADATARGPMADGELNVFLREGGFLLLFPMRGDAHWRIVGIVPPHLRDGRDLAFDDLRPSLAADLGDAFAVDACAWFSTYRIHHRRAERFGLGRLFLLGDAAHIHSPVGAQGMNTGLQDAANLGWKLARVVRGEAPEALVDSYAIEREPVAQRLLATTDRAFAFVVSDAKGAAWLRTRAVPRLLAFAMRFRAVREFAFRTIAQIGIAYRKSPLSLTEIGWPRGAPAAGDRFPWLGVALVPGGPPIDLFTRLDAKRFTWIVFGDAPAGALPPALAEAIDTVVVPPLPANTRLLARARIAPPMAFLVRPDGYIALATRRADVEALTGAWRGRFGPG
jgi:2-polyprenyl-6-methoxyphenol hydroxylase-like FAD-dependent oxidoreductase